jgi:hypothetical protein
MWLTEGKKKHKHLASDDRHRVHPFPQRENEKKEFYIVKAVVVNPIISRLQTRKRKKKKETGSGLYASLEKKMLFPIELPFVLLFFIFSSIAVCCDGPNVRRRTFTYREYIKAQRAQMDKNKDKNKRKRETRA